jgi:hypothetical protein
MSVTPHSSHLSGLSPAEEAALTDGVMVVLSIVRTSPAEESGLKCGDIVTRVSLQPVAQAPAFLRWSAGTKTPRTLSVCLYALCVVAQFGPLSRETFRSLQQIVPLVKNHAGKPIPITVLRKAHYSNGGAGALHVGSAVGSNGSVVGAANGYLKINLHATPARWSQGGVLVSSTISPSLARVCGH